jgi:hypothetical protein
VIRTLVVDDNRSFVTAATEVVLAADGFELAGVAQSGRRRSNSHASAGPTLR